MNFKIIITIILMFNSLCFATIDIIVKTPECVVFASDSRTTESSTAIASDTYEKIVKVTNYIMVQMAGRAYSGNMNLKTTIQDFKWKHNICDTSKIYIDSLMSLFRGYCESQKLGGVNFGDFIVFMAGPNDSGNVKCYEYTPSSDKVLYYENTYGVLCKGTKKVFERIIFGIDADLRNSINLYVDSAISDILTDSLKNSISDIVDKYEKNDSIKNSLNINIDSTILDILGRVPKNGLSKIIDKYQIATNAFMWSLIDAIDYAYLLVNSTILIDRMCGGQYKIGQESINPRTGGNIILCVVTRDGVNWIIPPNYSPE